MELFDAALAFDGGVTGAGPLEARSFVSVRATDDPAELETLFGWGVDAVASNDPAAAIAIRERTLGDQ